jgi:hypothetical protein
VSDRELLKLIAALLVETASAIDGCLAFHKDDRRRFRAAMTALQNALEQCKPQLPVT